MARALRAEPGSVLVFLPGAGGNPPHRDAAAASAIDDPAVDVVTLYGALDAQTQDRAIAPAPPGRRKVVLATSIAETSLTIEGVRIVVDCGLARVPRYEPDVGAHAARNRARVARRRRPAPRPRRPHRARRLLPAVGRAADRVARGLCAAGNPRRRSVRLAARSRAMGRGRSRDARVPRSAARGRAHRGEGAAASSLARSMREGRITDEGRKLRALPLPPRLARMVVDAAARGRGPARRRHRRDPVASAGSAATTSISATGSISSAATARAAARTRGAWRSAGRRCRGAARQSTAAEIRTVGRRHPRARLSRPHRQEPRRQTARSCSPTAAAPTSIRPRRWRASRSSRSPNLPARRRRAASCSRRRSRSTRSKRASPTGSRAAKRSPSTPRRASLRGRRSERLGAIALAERPMPVDAGAETRAQARRRHRAARPRPAALDASRCNSGATG